MTSRSPDPVSCPDTGSRRPADRGLCGRSLWAALMLCLTMTVGLTTTARGQLSQTNTAVPVGEVKRVKGAAELISGANTKLLAPGDKVVQRDRIRTRANGQALLQLLDNTVFTIGPNSDVILDEFVFAPDRNIGQTVTSVLRGTFHFVSGRIAKSRPDAMTIKLPVGTIGVRGTVGAGETNGAGASVLLLDPQGVGNGAMTVTTRGGQTALVQPNDGVDLGGPDDVPATQMWSPERVNALLAQLGLQQRTQFDPQQQGPAADPGGPVRFSYAECSAIVNRAAKLDLGIGRTRPPGTQPAPAPDFTMVSLQDFLRYGVNSAQQLFDQSPKRVGVVQVLTNSVVLGGIRLDRPETDGLVRLCRDRFGL